MTINTNASFHIHPGIWLREEMVDPSCLSVTDLAKHLNVSRQALSMLLRAFSSLMFH